jgi:hypothetical protein
MLDAIKTFAIHDDENDWKRCLVCGVIWLPGSIAINTRQLRLLIDKCKSSINGSLHRMGYSSVTSRGDTSKQLIESVPQLRGNFGELRQWTVRQIGAQTPQPAMPVTLERMGNAQTLAPECDMGEWDPMFERRRENENEFFDDELALPLLDWVGGGKWETVGELPGLQDREFVEMDLL